MRQGEPLGLRWSDVDWEAGSVRVQQQILRSHRDSQVEERSLAGTEWQAYALVFASKVGTPVERQNLMRRSFCWPILTRAKLPQIRFHDLRHTAATLLLTQGVHPKVVQERLGHATISVTMDVYSHVMPNLQQEAAEKLDVLPSSFSLR